MSINVLSLRRPATGLAACVLALVVGGPLAAAAPTADSQGFVDSTARCTSPDTAVAFGNTATSRVAICKTPDGDYEYRGVRVRDGARLITSAQASGGGAYVAKADGFTYTVTSTSLQVSAGQQAIRTESWVTFSGPQTTTSPTTTGPTTTSPTTTAPSTTAPTTTAPTPPIAPLPAEVGGSGR